MDLDTFQNLCLVALSLVCIYLFKQKERVDELEARVESLAKHCKLDLDLLDLDRLGD